MADRQPDQDVQIDLLPNEVAPLELRHLGRRYWQHDGIDSTTDGVAWTFKTNELEFEGWSGTAHIAAAAAMTATAPGFACDECCGPLTLASRQTLADARRGAHAVCRTCQGTIDERAAKVLDPANLAGRERRTRDAADRRTEKEARDRSDRARRENASALEEQRREAIARRYPVEDDGGYSLAHAPLLARVGAFSVLHAVGDHGGLIYPVDYTRPAIAPLESFGRDLFIAAWHEGLLLIHPTSPSRAFSWNDDSAEFGKSVFPSELRFYVPGEGTLEDRLETFADALRDSLALGPMWSTDRDELAALASRVVADEAARYLVSELRDLRSPTLPRSTRKRSGPTPRAEPACSRSATSTGWHGRRRGARPLRTSVMRG